ncbi:MAG TPA: glycosyltransferase, partial [Propionibacteriaceae bacterium]|nr:glycosyltransferase [Propionibacteriaceae bacterium]
MAVALSVVIACKNVAQTIGVQLQALSKQRLDLDWEVLLCDNGSVDRTIEVADQYRGKVPGLRVVSAAGRSGPAFARNVGAAESAARWLAFVDGDDEVAADWLPAMVAGLRQHDLVAGRFEARRLNSPSVLRSRQLDQDTELQYSPFGLSLPHAGGGNLGVSRAVFEEVGGFDDELRCLEDTDFCWRVQLAGYPLVFWPDAVVHVRLRSSTRSMWTQGRTYGSAAAMLDARYRGTAVASQFGSELPPQDRRPVLVRRVAKVVDYARRPSQLVWQAGWFVGFRTPLTDVFEPDVAIATSGSNKSV